MTAAAIVAAGIVLAVALLPGRGTNASRSSRTAGPATAEGRTLVPVEEVSR